MDTQRLIEAKEAYWANAQRFYKENRYLNPQLVLIGLDKTQFTKEGEPKVAMVNMEFPDLEEHDMTEDHFFNTLLPKACRMTQDTVDVWGIGFISEAAANRIPTDLLENTGTVSELIEQVTNTKNIVNILLFRFETADSKEMEALRIIEHETIVVNSEGDLVPDIEYEPFEFGRPKDGPKVDTWQGPMANMYENLITNNPPDGKPADEL